MKQSLINLKDKLKKAGFKFEASASIYNPMEQFAEYVSTKEIIHSKIIAGLLNPNAEHQLGNRFLIKLLQSIGVDVPSSHFPETGNPIKLPVTIEIEKYAPTTLNGVEINGRIDIFLLVELADNRKYAIIIENKLNDASDQHLQLQRYNTFIHSQYKNYEIRTIYMPRIGDYCDYKDAKVINATMLAKIIDETLEESISPNKASIQSYSNYLKNISIRNIIMDNAKILESLTSADIQQAKAIKEAYDKLPEAFAEALRKTYEQNGYETQIASNYSNYCYIWDKKAYMATSLWLAVGFSHDTCYFYIVSNDIDSYNRYSTKLKVTESSKSYGYFWLKPIEESRFLSKFSGMPDSDRISEIINYWLYKLNQVANSSQNNEDTPSL